ncbi:MAG: phage major capsid protein [Gammaproteobacteria bacterium]|nr:MAG: phage major capsid protein [Gammaproteobacteria bacterium]
MTQKTKTKTIKSRELFREAQFDTRALDEDSRTVELAFSSEEPVERWFGQEILDHASSSVRLGRLATGGPLLVDHDHKDHIGVVESVTIDSDRVGRAKVRFGRSARAEEIFNDVKDGIKSKVSVGYRIHKMTLEDPSAEDEVYRASDWEPHEISIVSIPADNSVGVGRSDTDDENEITIQYEERVMPEQTAAVIETPKIDVKAERDHGATGERSRVQDILKLAREHSQDDLAERYIEQGGTVEAFRDVVETITAQSGAVRDVAPASHLDLTAEETREFSLMTAIRASVSGDWSKAGFERECSIAIADQLGREARGFFVPFDIQQRVMNVTTGAGAVGTDHLAGSFIDNLRANAVVGQAGATFLDGLVGNVDIPKKSGSATFSWLADDGDTTNTDLTLGSVAMSPKTIGGAVAMSRRLMKQSSPSIEAMVLADLGIGAALAIDLAALAGTGAANQPTGIVNTAGVNTQSIAASAGTGYPTWSELVGFESAVAADEALAGSLRYITTSAINGGLKVTAKDTGSGLFLAANGEANGYGVMVSNQLAAKQIIFGNFADVMIGMWGVLDIAPDTAAKAAAGGLVLRAFQDVDVAVRHAESFCINA